MTTQTIKMTRPYLCTLCGGRGTDPRTNGLVTALPPCPECNGSGILQVEETLVVVVEAGPGAMTYVDQSAKVPDSVRSANGETLSAEADEVSLEDAYHGSGSEVGVGDAAEPVHPDLHSEFHPGSRCPHCDSGDVLVYSASGNATTDPDRIECGNCKEVLWERDVADQPTTIDAAQFEKFDFTHPAGTPVSLFVSKDGGETEEIKLDNLDPNNVTAAQINALLREKGCDASMVHAMTPLHMLEHAERRAVQAEERRDHAQKREAAWVDWFEELRREYEGVTVDSHLKVHKYMSWAGLERHYPWPSLEDERAEAAMDE